MLRWVMIAAFGTVQFCAATFIILKSGNNTNIQDGAVIHATYKKSPTNIGNNVIIAHGAIVHGCTIKDNVMVGMNAVVLDDAVVESNSIIAAGGSCQ